jgi:hypothetical protein
MPAWTAWSGLLPPRLYLWVAPAPSPEFLTRRESLMVLIAEAGARTIRAVQVRVIWPIEHRLDRAADVRLDSLTARALTAAERTTSDV